MMCVFGTKSHYYQAAISHGTVQNPSSLPLDILHAPFISSSCRKFDYLRPILAMWFVVNQGQSKTRECCLVNGSTGRTQRFLFLLTLPLAILDQARTNTENAFAIVDVRSLDGNV